MLDGESLKNRILKVYLMRWLRGNTVVDVNHENTSVRRADMAEAMLNGKTSLTRSFMEV